jgi:hypothetical protein
MREKAEAQMTTRRTAFWILGMAAFGMGMPAAVLTASDAEAQTPGMERRQERRTGRHERRQDRRTGRTERRQERRTGTTGAGNPGTSTTGTGTTGTGTTGQAPRP